MTSPAAESPSPAANRLSQPESLLALLKECGALGIHRTVDTSGFAPTETLMNDCRA